jgi:peroxiredoxin
MRPFASVLFGGAVAVMVGCAAPEPPKVATAEPLVIGKSPPSAQPLAVDEKAAPASTKARGPKAPSFVLDSLTTPGKVTVLAGKVVVVHFWATWCEPCKKSLPALQELYTKHRASGLEVVAVAVDEDKAGIAEFARRHGARFPIGWDDSHGVSEGYAVQTMPSTTVIDREGNVAHVHNGYHDGEVTEIEREIKALLQP